MYPRLVRNGPQVDQRGCERGDAQGEGAVARRGRALPGAPPPRAAQRTKDIPLCASTSPQPLAAWQATTG